MDNTIEAIRMLILSAMENPMRIYLQRGIVKRIDERYFIFVDNEQIAAKYAEGTESGQEVKAFFQSRLGVEVGVRHIKDMTTSGECDARDLNSEEIELVQAYRNLDRSQKELIKRIIGFQS